MTRAGLWLNVAIAALGVGAFSAIAGYFGYKWLARDEPNRAHACGSGTRGGTCLDGGLINMILTVVFAAIAVITIALVVASIRSYRKTQRQRRGSASAPAHAALRLQQLETLRSAGVISDAEFVRQRQQVIADI